MTFGYGIIIYSLFKKIKDGRWVGAPLTLADVFLGLGSGFGGAGFCRDINYTNTVYPQDQKKKKKNTTKDNSPF